MLKSNDYLLSESQIRNEVMFEKACTNMHLSVAKTLFKNYKIKSELFHGPKLSYLCKKGNLKFVKWLYANGNPNMKSLIFAFKSACDTDKIEVAKWCHEKQNTKDKHIFCEQILYSLIIGAEKIFNWMRTLNIDEKNQQMVSNKTLFIESCSYGYADLAKEFLSYGDFSLDICSKLCLDEAYKKGYHEIIWLILNKYKPSWIRKNFEKIIFLDNIKRKLLIKYSRNIILRYVYRKRYTKNVVRQLDKLPGSYKLRSEICQEYESNNFIQILQFLH